MQVNFDPERDFELALCLAPEMGSSSIRSLMRSIAQSGLSAKDIFAMSAEDLHETFQIHKRAAKCLSNNAELLQSEILRYRARSHDKPLRLLSPISPLYPSKIEIFCKNAPACLFALGNLRLLSTHTFCVLASRNPTPDILNHVEKIAEEEVLSGKTLIASANTASYQRSAVIPLRWGTPRILVFDRGIFKAMGDTLDKEPFSTARLWRYKFDANTDLCLSPFRPDDPFIRGNYARRDELIVALSDEVIVVHESPGGNVARLSSKADHAGKVVRRLIS